MVFTVVLVVISDFAPRFIMNFCTTLALTAALCLSVASGSSAVPAQEVANDPRFAYVGFDTDGLRLSANSTSLVYGVLGALAVAVILLLLVPLLETFGITIPFNNEEPAEYASYAYHDTYSNYKRSLDAAIPILKHLQDAWNKYN